MKQCWISSVGNSFGFLESDTICPSLVSPGVVCGLNDIETKKLKYRGPNWADLVSFTIKCSTAICHISHPHCSTYHLIRPPPPSSLPNGITAREEVTVGHWCVFLPTLDSVARVLLRSILLTHHLLRTLSACPWECTEERLLARGHGTRQWWSCFINSPLQNKRIVCAMWRGPPVRNRLQFLQGSY